MSKFEDENYKERLLKYIFEYTWLEPPLFRYNEGKILYFDVESKPETQTAQLIKSVFDDVFFIGSKLFVVFYCYTDPMFRKLRCDWKDGKKYFKRFSLKKILQIMVITKKSNRGAVKRPGYYTMTHGETVR